MRKLHVGVVTTFPPGTGSLNEYAFHFVKAMRGKSADLHKITLFVDHLPDGEQYPNENGDVPMEIVPCWSFGSLKNPLSVVQAVRKAKPDVVLFNLQFASFGDSRVPAALGLFTPRLVKSAGFPSVVLLHNIMETVDLKNTGFAGNPLVEWVTRTAGAIVTKGVLSADLVALTDIRFTVGRRDQIDRLGGAGGEDNLIFILRTKELRDGRPRAFILLGCEIAEVVQPPVNIGIFLRIGLRDRVDHHLRFLG